MITIDQWLILTEEEAAAWVASHGRPIFAVYFESAAVYDQWWIDLGERSEELECRSMVRNPDGSMSAVITLRE
jgi:hypothetical protein